MKIGELATAGRARVETIRYYEREGLLPQAPRSAGNYRIYGPDHVERLGFIRHCRSLDMTLDEIRVLLRFKDSPSGDCGAVNALLDEHIGHVAARIRELRALEKQLKALHEQCVVPQDARRCGILNGLSRPAAPPPAEPQVAGSHVGRRQSGAVASARRGSTSASSRPRTR